MKVIKVNEKYGVGQEIRIFKKVYQAAEHYGCTLTNPSYSRFKYWMERNTPHDVYREELNYDEPVNNQPDSDDDHTVPVVTEPLKQKPDNDDVTEALLALKKLMSPASQPIDKYQVEQIVKDYTDKHMVKRLKIVDKNDVITGTVDGAHKDFPELLIHIQSGEPTLLVGPAGSFKTSSVHKAADELKLKFYSTSVGMQTTQSHLLGFVDAAGNYHRTALREAYENGGVFLLDEIDAGNANTLTVLNSAISNGSMTFPDSPKPVKAHQDFRCVATANTFGTGADAQYVGRNQLDAASLDRFDVMEWGYDEKLERQIANNDEWVDRVQIVRNAVQKLNIKHVVSPRASFKGSKLLQLGLSMKKVEKSVLFKGLKDRDVERIKTEAGL